MQLNQQILWRCLKAVIAMAGCAVCAFGGSFNTDFTAGLPDNAHIFGGTRPDGSSPYPVIEDGVLKLTFAAEKSETASMIIDDLDAGQVVGSFIAKFKLLIGEGTGADGFSFNFAPDLNDGGIEEEGSGTGLTVAFDTYDNGGGEAPAIDIKIAGQVVQHKKAQFLRANKFLDVTIEAKENGTLSISYGPNIVYSNVFGYVPTSGRFAFGARTGGSTDNHWIDDINITTTPLTGPYVKLARPSGENVSATPDIRIEIADGSTQVNQGTVKAQFDGEDVGANVSQNGGVTVVTYSPTALLASGTSHTLNITYTDSGGTARQAQTSFTIANYTLLPGSAALTASDVDTTKPGFQVRPVQAPQGANLPNTLARADAQLAGILIDPQTQQPYLNKAVAGPNGDGSYDEPAVIDYDTVGNHGNFQIDAAFPGLPGTEGNTDSSAEDITTYLELQKGFYTFGVNSDDGFRLTAGANPQDAFATTFASWDGTRGGGGDTVFNFVAEQAGIYPFRLVWENGAGDGTLEFYSVSPVDGPLTLINDASSANAVKAYRTRKSSGTLPAYVLTVSPQPGEQNVSKRPAIKAVLLDAGTQVVSSSVKLFLDGTSVNANVANNAGQTTVSYQQGAELPNLSTHTLRLVFSDNASPANVRTQDWQFTTARVLQVTGQWDFDQGDLRATIGTAMQYGDGPSGRVKDHTSFGTTTSFGIADIGGKPGKVMKYTRDEFEGVTDQNPHGYLMAHGMAPNGGGTKVNQFTMIVDMMIPDMHMGDSYNTVVKWEAVDDFNIDGSISIKANDIGGDNTGGIGISGQYTGDGVTWIKGGSWQRVAVVVDMAATIPNITYYIDGVKFGQMVNGDRWGFDQRHAIPPIVRLYGDGEGDNEVNTVYVNSVQFRDGTMTAAEVAGLGAASASGIPFPGRVGGQWDFDQGDLRATVGEDMQYGDGLTGRIKDHTSFGSTTSFGIPDIGGKPADVMKYTRDDFEGLTDQNPRGYLISHGLLPNGGGTKVNQFTMLVDMMIPDMHMGDSYNTVIKWEAVDDFNIDGSISIKANDIGGDNTGGIGISGQYTGDGITWIKGGSWQRIAVVVDMAAAIPNITYYIDGVKFGQMVNGDRWGFDQRHAIPPTVRLYGDGEGDNEVNTVFVNSVQFRDGTITAEQAAALGAASANGIPLVIPTGSTTENPRLKVAFSANSLTISWDSAVTGFTLESVGTLTSPQWSGVQGVNNNSITISAPAGTKFYRLKK
jgi:hypothetical protein